MAHSFGTVLAHIQGDVKTVVHGLRNSDGNLSASHIEVKKLLPYYFGICNAVRSLISNGY